MMTDEIKTSDDRFIVIAAFRYAVGRHTAAPDIVSRWIEERKHLMPTELRAKIASEIREEAERYLNTVEDPFPDGRRWLELAASLEQANASPPPPRAEEK